ncbi:MAG: restriction endonuclease subunit S [Thermomonas sp.]
MKKLGDVCQTGSGGTPLSSNRDYYEGGTIPWLLSGEVSQGDVHAASKFITKQGLESSAAKLFPENTVLIAMYGATAGQVGILRFEAATNQAVCGILPNKIFIPKFMFYLFLSKKKELVAQAAGNAQPNISQMKIRNTEVPLVSMQEQQRIVAILDEAFAGIATAKANAERNLRNAREVFENHLGSVFKSYSDMLPGKALGETFNTATGNTPPKSNSDYYGDFMPLVKPPELRDNVLDSAPDGLSEAGAAVARTLPPNSILVSCIGNLGKIGLNAVPVAFNQQINAILPDESKAIPEFMFFQTLSSQFSMQLRDLASGTTVPIVNKSKFNGIRISLPELSEQQLIVEQLESLRSESRRLESIYTRKLTALDDLKQSLLHQAFSGQL